MAWNEVRAIVFDVDGVLTDGRLYYGPDGEVLKVFHVRDGHAIKQFPALGIQTAICTGRTADAITVRAGELGFDAVLLGCADKAAGIQKLSELLDCPAEAMLYVGDDSPDLPAIEACGHSACPSDAVPEVRAAVEKVLETPGGMGVAREVLSLLAAAQPQT